MPTNHIITELVALLSSPLRIPRTRSFEPINVIKSVPDVQMMHINEATELSANRNRRRCYGLRCNVIAALYHYALALEA